MFTLYLVVTAITVVANAAVAAADFGRAEFVLATMAEVGIAGRWLPVSCSLSRSSPVARRDGGELESPALGRATAVHRQPTQGAAPSARTVRDTRDGACAPTAR